MGNSNCKRCFSRDKEKDSEIKLGPEINDIIDIDINSPKMTNINEANPKDDVNILSADLNNIENIDQNILESKNESKKNKQALKKEKNDSSFMDDDNDEMKNSESKNLNHNLEEEENDQEQEMKIVNKDMKMEKKANFKKMNNMKISMNNNMKK